jgi:hypothetical protein
MIEAAFSLPPVWKSVESIIRLPFSINARSICVIARAEVARYILVLEVVLFGTNVWAGELPARGPLDTLWEQQMLESKSNTVVAIELKEGKIVRLELPAKESVEYSRGMPESTGFGSPGVSIMQLGEGFWGNGGWVLKGGLLGIATDGPSAFELHGKAVVHRQPYFPFPFHRTIPHDTGYEFFLLHRHPGFPDVTIVGKWTFTPQQVDLKPQNVGPPDVEVHATLRYDPSAKIATVTITGVTSAIEENINVSTYTSASLLPVKK